MVDFLLLSNFVCSFFPTEGNLNQICHLLNNIFKYVCMLFGKTEQSVTTPLPREVAKRWLRAGSNVYVLNTSYQRKLFGRAIYHYRNKAVLYVVCTTCYLQLMDY